MLIFAKWVASSFFAVSNTPVFKEREMFPALVLCVIVGLLVSSIFLDTAFLLSMV